MWCFVKWWETLGTLYFLPRWSNVDYKVQLMRPFLYIIAHETPFFFFFSIFAEDRINQIRDGRIENRRRAELLKLTVDVGVSKAEVKKERSVDRGQFFYD